MKLDRQIPENAGRGKYALVRMRDVSRILREGSPPAKQMINNALNVLLSAGVLDYGEANTPGEFFVIRLRDKFARAALGSYGINAIDEGGEFAEFGQEVLKLADRAGAKSPFSKLPD